MMLVITILTVCFVVFAMGDTIVDVPDSGQCETQICEIQRELLTLKSMIANQETQIALQKLHVEGQNSKIANQNTRITEEVAKATDMDRELSANILDLRVRVHEGQYNIDILKQHLEKECPSGWVKHNEMCYLIVDNGTESWSDAVAKCQEFGGELAVIKDAVTNVFLKEKCKQSQGNYFWLGATDRQTEGTWLWEKSGSPVVFSDWNDHQPDNYQSNQDCLALFKDYSFRWDDGTCSYKAQYICESAI